MFGENKIFESIDNLFDIIDGDRGKNYPKSDELFSEEYCLFLNTKNVTKNGFSFDTKQFITKTKQSNLSLKQRINYFEKANLSVMI